MKFDDREILSLCVAYSAAKAACLRMDAEVAALAAEGDHKHKNKLIHTKGTKASIAKNKAAAALLAKLDEGAVEAIRRADASS